MLAGEYYRAIERFRNAVTRNRNYVDPLAGLAESYFQLGEFDQGLSYADRARSLAPYRIDLMLLEARLLVANGRIEEAEALYDEVLQEQPYNVRARIGLAELSAAQGSPDRADSMLQEAVRLEPANRKTLLSLAVLAEYRGQYDEAQRYIERALENHPRDASVQTLAAEHYLARGQLERAAMHIESAAQLNPDSSRVLLLQAEIALERGRYEEAIRAADAMLSQNRSSRRAWYIRAVAHEKLGEFQESARSFMLGLRAAPSDEALRLRYEEMALANFEAEGEVRTTLANYHFDAASELRNRNLFDLAAQELRRGLKLNPFSREGRLSYAELFRFRGFNARYLEQLRVLREQGHTDSHITDRIETYESVRADSVARQWGIDQFTLDRDRITVSLYAIRGESRVTYPELVPALLGYVRDTMLAHEHIDFAGASPQVTAGYAEAFHKARSADSDYFLTVRFREYDSSLEIASELYAARSGNRVAQYSSVRVGNNRFRDGADTVADAVAADLPLRGSIIRREADTVILNVGRVHGLENDQQLTVVRPDSLVVAGESPGFAYSSEDIIGTVTVTATDDLIAQGTIEQDSLYDLVDIGAQVVLDTDEGGSRPSQSLFPPIYRRLRSIQ